MKAIAALLICATLTACGDCPPDAVTGSADTAIAAPSPAPVQTPAPAPQPEPQPITYCPESSGTVCPPSPTPAPVRPVVIDPTPTPTCTRNADPLVYVDPFWVDNCGNKYGSTDN